MGVFLCQKSGVRAPGWQLVNCLTLDLSSGLDLSQVMSSSPVSVSTLRMEPSWDSVSLFLSLPCSLTVSQSKLINIKKKKPGVEYPLVLCTSTELKSVLVLLQLSRSMEPLGRPLLFLSVWCQH